MGYTFAQKKNETNFMEVDLLKEELIFETFGKT